jgi:hypothetical protein
MGTYKMKEEGSKTGDRRWKECLHGKNLVILDSHHKFWAEAYCLEASMVHDIGPSWSVRTTSVEQGGGHVNQAVQVYETRSDDLGVFAVSDLSECLRDEHLVLLLVDILRIDWLGSLDLEVRHGCVLQDLAHFIQLLFVVSLNSNILWPQGDLKFGNHDTEDWPAARRIRLLSNVCTVVETNVTEHMLSELAL